MRKAPFLPLWLAAVATVAVQAMALATRYFQPWLDGDYLLPERFATDVVAGIYPLSGWTLSSSPYLFPDFALSIAWHAVLRGAPLLPFYVVTSYLALALLTGWSLQRLGQPEGRGWLLGALLVNVLLACQGLADHARWLWWLGTATFHGGAVLLGLAQFALWAGPPGTAPGRSRTLVATILLCLGLASDALLLTQFVVPLGLALFLTAEEPRWRSPRLRSLLTALGLAGLFVAVLRAALHFAQWWNFPSVVRHAPTPPAVAGATGRMLTDLAGPVSTAVPVFVALLILGSGAALWLGRRKSLGPEQRQAGWFAGACLASTLALPALAVYWQNPQNGRYLLPCMVIPLWWLLILLPKEKSSGPLVGGIVAMALLGLLLWRAPQIDFSQWARPYPERVAALDRFLATQGQTRGLADFWHANYLNFTSRQVHLNQLRPDGRVQFWGNNAFHHFETENPDNSLRPPRYDFIIANDLDWAALREKFGEPHQVHRVGDYVVWLYDEPSAQRVSALVDTEVRAFLRDRPGTERIANQ